MENRGQNAAYDTLLEINNAIISNLTREALFHAIAVALRRVIPFDRTAVFLHDADRDVLSLFILESSLPTTYFRVGLEMRPNDSHVGWVFKEQKALLRRNLERERHYPPDDWAHADGVRSYIIVPLVVRGRSIGTLAVASTVPDQYSETDAAFLQEAAIQVALAIENMQAYEALTRAEEMLREIAEGTAAVTGHDFFHSLVRHLASALRVRYAFLTECLPDPTRVRTLAFWKGDGFAENFEYDVTPTPCRIVLEGKVAAYPADVQHLFPGDRDLVDLAAQSYFGIPVQGASGRVAGHLAVLDDKPFSEAGRAAPVLRAFAARAGAELERLAAEERLRAALAEVETLKNRLHAENVYLQEEIRGEHNFVEMVGSSPALLAALRQVEQVASTDSTVLILGETGTGKELIARAIHSRSGRRERPLVKVNCSAISAGLVESELFGHVKGAFTGALERRIGRFELADGGTLFLDEVGDLPLETQVKLLRVLQEREFEPVGSNRTLRVNVRVIAATNRNLEEAVAAGRFRADLFYRLNVFPLRVPALRDRRGDIPQLVMFFVSRFAKELGKPVEAVSQPTMERLVSYDWPGNVRELANIIERATVLASGRVLELDADLLPVGPDRAVGSVSSGSAPVVGQPLGTLEEIERRHIREALERSRWVIEGSAGAARVLGLHPNTLRSRMAKLGISRPPHGIS
ncbi:MAG TPA: sigma 54-interacting transcriptional regulator [Methylomirabilota bacterium]|nr:sigma 54-interacting transcriptional regulator [Methylomirabilota bacterium]